MREDVEGEAQGIEGMVGVEGVALEGRDEHVKFFEFRWREPINTRLKFRRGERSELRTIEDRHGGGPRYGIDAQGRAASLTQSRPHA